MPHVDDGQLHAFLDGELETAYPGEAQRVEDHLAACAVCRARLSDAQGTRLRARSLLRDGAPIGLERPDFDTLAARVAVRAAPPSRHSTDHRRALHRRAVTLGWAASLVVALCAGWFARDARLRLDEPGPYAAREMQAVPTVRSTGPDAAPEEQAADLAAAAVPVQLPAGREPGSLSVEQFFSLYEALPEPEHLQARPHEAAEPLRRWERSHPQLAQASPAVHILRWFWSEFDRKEDGGSG